MKLGTCGPPDEPIVFVPYDQAYQTDFEDMRRRVPDNRKIQEFIGWTPRLSLDETLQDIVNEFIESNAPQD